MTYIEDKLFPPEREIMQVPLEDEHPPPSREHSSYHSDDDREVEMDEEAYRQW